MDPVVAVRVFIVDGCAMAGMVSVLIRRHGGRGSDKGISLDRGKAEDVPQAIGYVDGLLAHSAAGATTAGTEQGLVDMRDEGGIPTVMVIDNEGRWGEDLGTGRDDCNAQRAGVHIGETCASNEQKKRNRLHGG